jgi:hypothetical protein
MGRCVEWDERPAHRRLSAAWWPTVEEVTPKRACQLLTTPPARATRDPLEVKAERELIERLLGS